MTVFFLYKTHSLVGLPLVTADDSGEIGIWSYYTAGIRDCRSRLRIVSFSPVRNSVGWTLLRVRYHIFKFLCYNITWISNLLFCIYCSRWIGQLCTRKHKLYYYLTFTYNLYNLWKLFTYNFPIFFSYLSCLNKVFY